MLEFFQTLLASKQYIPHGHCYLWQSKLVALHILSDSLIALAYYSIPVTLLYFVCKRQDLPFNGIFWLFAIFIIICGTTHVMEIWTLWYPTYWLSGGLKAIAAVISLYTAYELIYLMPKALAFPSPAQLEATNRELEREICDRKQAELALQEREAMLRRIGDNLPNGAVYKIIRELDGSDRFSYLSAGIEQLTEVSAEAALNDPSLLHRQFIPEDIPRFQTAVDDSAKNLSIFDIQLRICTPSGQLKWFHFRSSPRQLEDGRIAWDGLVVDETELKRTELEIIHSRDLREAIFNESTDALFLVDGKTLLNIDCNQRAVELFAATSKAELMGIEGQTLQKRQFTCEELAGIVKQIRQQGFWSQEIEYVTKRGNCFWGNIAAKQIRVGEQLMNLVKVTDITDQKHAQKMLELQAVITRNMAEGLCLVRATDGIIVYANPKFEQMFGYERDELIGQHVSIVNYAGDRTTPEQVNQTISDTILKNGEATYKVHNVKKDGTPFWCSATASIFEHPEYGTVLVAVQQDITEHKQAEEQIKASLKEKEVLLKEIHHRVKNNLGIVSSLLQMQCRRTEDSQAIAILRDSQNRITSIALVHEKLYRSGDLANIDFAQYIPDLTTHLFDSYNISPNSIKLNIQVDNASLDIETAIPCGLIINELVSNALKYAFSDRQSGEIQVKLSQENQYNLILIIQDNGVGLPADFDHKKAKTLGITLVQGLVKQLRGTVEINCQQGTEFKIKFSKSRA